MTFAAGSTLAVYMVVLLVLAVPLGAYIARVEAGKARWSQRFLGPVERLLLRCSRIDATRPMSARQYTRAVLIFGLGGLVAVYLLQALQGWLPLNPAGHGAVGPAVAFNTAVSFVTNTNWQVYSGESSLSHLTQMLGLTVQNFLSAATGIAVLWALTRGLVARGTAGTGTANRAEAEAFAPPGLGNFWADLVRITVYVLLPLSVALAVALVSQGVVQSLQGSVTVDTLAGGGLADAARQVLPLGPAASQVAIKQLGTNGGGFFGVNSAHPFENPNHISNLLQMLAILLIPAALCFAFGARVRDRRQGVALAAIMVVLLVPFTLASMAAEQAGNPLLTPLGVDSQVQMTADGQVLSAGGNLEGKEVRFGAIQSALWASVTTAASNGSVNSMHDSFTPLGGLFPLWFIQLGEVVFGGVGSGLYGLLIYVWVAVFVAGLMVGRTPEYLGKKIEAFEVRMAALVILIPAAATLLGTALALALPGVREATLAAMTNPGTHGFSEVLYAFSSGANNNGSAFGGLNGSGGFLATAIGICMALGRYGVIVPVLAIAGSLARKRAVPAGPGTLPTHTPLFVLLVVLTVLLVGALTFIPALALGPIAEHFALSGG